MSDSRTPEQKAADEALTEAIESVQSAYHEPDGDPSVLTEYIVIYVRRGWDEDGDSTTETGLHPRDNSVPLYAQIGMTEYVLTVCRNMIGGGD